MQEVSKTEAGIAGLHHCSMVAHTALAIVNGRQYAVVRPCSSSCISLTEATRCSQASVQCFPVPGWQMD